MYKLDSVPIFYEFLDLFLKAVNSKVKIKRSNKLFLYDKCVCNKNHCNSFILKTTKKITKNSYLYHSIVTNKGTFGIELCDDGTFMFAAIDNPNFPFKQEFEQMFKHYKATARKTIIPYYPKKKLSKKDKQRLYRFFYDLKYIDICYDVDESIDSCIKRYI